MTGPYVALLRGINVGGRNKLPMRDLVAIFVDAGCTDVATYIQSGNVVFCAGAKLAAQIPGIISDSIAERLDLRVPVVIRSAAEFKQVIACNPYLQLELDFTKLHVVFLADRPTSAACDTLDPNRSPGDAYRIRGGEIYLHLPNGAAKTKLSNAYFDSKLGTVSTGRNWRTVLKLHELAEPLLT